VAKRQVVLMAGGGRPGEVVPLGTPKEVAAHLAKFNTAPDGSGAGGSSGMNVLHGPGLVVEYPTALEEVNQAMVTVVDDSIAWPVLTRLCKKMGWCMMDMESGRRFG
jgi:hypothetical protein